MTTQEEGAMSIKTEPESIMQVSTLGEHEVLYTRSGNSYYPYSRKSNYQSNNKLNPIVNGARMKCIRCKSIYHLIKDCKEEDNRYNDDKRPDQRYKDRRYKNRNKESYIVEDQEDPEEVYIALFASQHSRNVEENITDCYMTTFVGECLGKGILDCGCPHSVAGYGWSAAYVESLDEEQKGRVKITPTKAKYRFGNGEAYQASKKMTVPAQLGNKPVLISYDVVEADVPLLLGKDTMKKAETEIYLHKDSVTMLGSNQPLCYTSSGHYAVPLNPKVRAIESEKPIRLLLSIDNISEKPEKEKEKLAWKLHQQFAHATSNKLKKLLKDSCIEDPILIEKIEELDTKCRTCRIYKKPPSRPVVCMALSRGFIQVISMDLKFYTGKNNST